MKFLIDANLPPSLKIILNEYDVLHTLDLEMGNLSKDKLLNNISLEEKRILITKDTDFYYSYITEGRPFKLVLVKLGNLRVRELMSYFRMNHDRIVELLEKSSFIILERKKIRVLD